MRTRSTFLKKAGVGTVALAAVPLLAESAGAHGGGPRFIFLAVSKGPTTPDGVAHRLLMGGIGHFHGQDIRGAGSFNWWDGASPIPQKVLASGRWKVTKPIGVDVVGTWGVVQAGVIEAEVELRDTGGKVTPGTLRVICNVGPAGLSTGRGQEGFYLTLADGTAFEPFGPAGGFPGLGITDIFIS